MKYVLFIYFETQKAKPAIREDINEKNFNLENIKLKFV
jgi:hypothetical protein